MPVFPFLRVKVSIEGVGAISAKERGRCLGPGTGVDEGVVRVDCSCPVDHSALKSVHLCCHEVAPSEVKDTVLHTTFAPMHGYAWLSEQLQNISGSPFFEVRGSRAWGPTSHGPCVGVEVEVTHEKGWEEGIKVKGEKGVESTRVIRIVVEVDDAPGLGASANINNEKGGVWCKVFAGCDHKFVAAEGVVVVMYPRVYHHLGSLGVVEEGVV